jgi:hypothetical protein
MKRIVIEVIPHAEQRYDTCGDWQFDNEGNLNIKVSDTGDDNYNFLVARHEMDEAWLCQAEGISQQQVDEFDLAHPDDDQPGENPDAPYYNQHLFATAAEQHMALALQLDWHNYEQHLEALNEHETPNRTVGQQKTRPEVGDGTV